MALHDNGRVVFGFLVAGFAAGVAIATAWSFKAVGNDWDMWSAFGAIAAATVACGIALADGRRRKKEGIERARLVASFSRHRVAWLEGELSTVAMQLEQASQFDCDPLDFTRHTNRLITLKVFTVQDIEPLVPLPNNCAHNLAAGLDNMGLAKTILEAVIYSESINVSDDRKNFAGQAAAVVRTAYGMIRAAGAEMQAASFAAFQDQG